MHLNLARKWRSKHFDEVVGQPLVVRLVKNSLYRNLIFPVYLLSGTRGCGKTSVARIFAAALNCDALDAFQKNPQNQQLPCLSCASCTAMQAMKHPDFIEIDAASHTGVDNVRAIIDAASFVPVLGKKKIYLIDEAHMLSKAAFNAFLKILEEPPVSVVFMLATTDPHKILETVTSRCFQLFFDPIEVSYVAQHLAYVCNQEGVTFEQEALTLIAHETEGSMRDALNLVERIRIAYPSITQKAVIELLGKIDDERLCELLHVVLQGAPQDVLAAIKRLELEKYNSYLVWKSFVEIIRQSLWVKNGVNLEESGLQLKLKEITAQASLEQLIRLFEICYDYEMLFAKTASPAHMLEMMLLKMAAKNTNAEPPQMIRPKKTENTSDTKVRGAIQDPEQERLAPAQKEEQKEKIEETQQVAPHEEHAKNNEEQQPAAHSGPWAQCLQEIEKLNDPLVASIFKQGMLRAHHENTKELEIIFSQDLLFFKEWLENTQKVWQPTIITFFGEGTTLVPRFTGAPKERPSKLAPQASVQSNSLDRLPEGTITQGPQQAQKSTQGPAQAATQQIQKTAPRPAQAAAKQALRTTPRSAPAGPARAAPAERVVTITDPEKWQKAHALLQIFPGTLVVSQESLGQESPAQEGPGQESPDGEGA